jgi:hypothetical protein
MERRVLLAVILSFIVCTGSRRSTRRLLIRQRRRNRRRRARPPRRPTLRPRPLRIRRRRFSRRPPLPAESGAPQTPTRELVVDNPDVRAVFTTRGAVLKSWQLRKYRDDQQQPYEVVAGHAPPDAPLPFTMVTDEAAVSALLAAASSRRPSRRRRTAPGRRCSTTRTRRA